jgi:hypothetical protein
LSTYSSNIYYIPKSAGHRTDKPRRRSGGNLKNATLF